MNNAIIILIVFIIFSFKPEKCTEIEYKNESFNLNIVSGPNIKSEYIKDLSKLDESKFPNLTNDSIVDIRVIKYNELPELTEVTYFDSGKGLGKYFINKTFSKKFKTYILGINEGGDCSPALTLLNVRNDSLLDRIILSIDCGWEKGIYRTESKFKNDSTFIINYRGSSCDNGVDSIFFHTTSKTYIIGRSGRLKLKNEIEKKWNIPWNENRWLEIRKNLMPTQAKKQ